MNDIREISFESFGVVSHMSNRYIRIFGSNLGSSRIDGRVGAAKAPIGYFDLQILVPSSVSCDYALRLNELIFCVFT